MLLIHYTSLVQLQKPWVVLLIGTTLLAACNEEVDITVPTVPARLVANAFLQADSAVALELSQSQSVLANTELETVSGATATLLEEGQEVATLTETEPGVYRSDFTPSVGRQYTLRVSKEGFEPVEATTFVRPPVAIDEVNISVDTTTFSFGDSVVYQDINVNEVWVTWDDPADERNYYEVVVFQYDTLLPGESSPNGIVATDTLRYADRYGLGTADPAVAETQVTNLPEADGCDAFALPLVFTDEFINGRTHTLRLCTVGTSRSGPLYVVLRSINEEEYQYLRSFSRIIVSGDNSLFGEPIQVNSNVTNGYGIVSGSSADGVALDVG